MTCNEVLRREGKRYPRTCAECRLGPCTYKLEVKIKPLVWVQTGRDWRAATPIGTYEVWEVMGNNRWRWMQQGFPGSYCDSEALAKAWCQAEYERRVRECLE